MQLTGSSPLLARMAMGEESVRRVALVSFNVESSKGVKRYTVDSDFFELFRKLPAEGEVVKFVERTRQLKQLNDRLVIQKIRKNMLAVCPLCLGELIEKIE